MATIKPHEYDPEAWDDDAQDNQLQPMRRQTDKATTPKDARRQRAKEWGRSMAKFQKQRERGNGKP